MKNPTLFSSLHVNVKSLPHFTSLLVVTTLLFLLSLCSCSEYDNYTVQGFRLGVSEENVRNSFASLEIIETGPDEVYKVGMIYDSHSEKTYVRLDFYKDQLYSISFYEANVEELFADILDAKEIQYLVKEGEFEKGSHLFRIGNDIYRNKKYVAWEDEKLVSRFLTWIARNT